MDTNSKEYQEAFGEMVMAFTKFIRIAAPEFYSDEVKHAELLAVVSRLAGVNHISSTGSTNKVNIPVGVENTVASGKTIEQITQPVSQELKSTRYATSPDDEDGMVFFRRTTDSTEEDDDRNFVLKIYNDDTCEFFMKDDIRGQKMQMLVDCKEQILNPKAVKYIGQPSASSIITTKIPGKAKKEGKKYVITKPLEIEFE